MKVKCPSCGSYATVTETKYGTRNDCCGLWSWGGKPLVDAETHSARKNAHLIFDELWKSHGLSRSKAYKLLAKYLPKGSETHMSYMSKQECAMVPETVKKILHNYIVDEQNNDDKTEKVNPHIGSLFSDLKTGLEEALEHEEGKETSIQIHQVQDFRFRATTDNKATTEITELPKNE